MSQEEAVKSVFDTHALLYQEKYMDVKAYSEALSLFAENLPSPNPKIIDLACGPANLSFFFKKLVPNAQIHGCDFAPGMIKLAKTNVPDGNFEIADAFQFLEKHSKVDGIIAGFLIPYFSPTKTKSFLSVVKSSLDENGVLYLSAMEGAIEKSGTETPSSDKGKAIQTYYYPKEFLRLLLEEAGFSILYEKVQPFEKEPERKITDLIFVAQNK